MSKFRPQNGEMFKVNMFDYGIADDNNEVTLFVSDSRKMANEVVDALNDLELDNFNNLNLKELKEDWVRQFLFDLGYKNQIPCENGNLIFDYVPVVFATTVSEEEPEKDEA